MKKRNKKSKLPKFLSKDISVKRIARLLITPLIVLGGVIGGYHSALNQYNPHTAYDNFLNIGARAYVVGCQNAIKGQYESGGLKRDVAEQLYNACKEAFPTVRQDIESQLSLEWLFTKPEDSQEKRK